jgi:hypothetical protein
MILKTWNNINFVFLFIILMNTNIYSQSNTHNFKVNGKNELDLPYMGMQFEFKKEVLHLDEKRFKEFSIVNKKKENGFEFKIIRDKWYLKQNKKWTNYFDFSTNKGGDLYLSELKYKVVFSDTITIQKKLLYAIYYKPYVAKQNHLSLYLIDPIDGIVLVSNRSFGVNLIRTDFFTTALTEKEEKEIFKLKML